MNVAIIQARLGSTRLPGKVLLPLGSDTVLQCVVKRVQAARLVDTVWVVTSVSPEDKRIVRACAEAGLNVFLGSESDVLDRFYQLAKHLPRDCNLVRITADCPLMDPSVIDLVIKIHLDEKNDYTSNTLKPTFPDGEDVEVFTFRALECAWKSARLTSEREHVTPYIKKHSELFRLRNVENSIDLSSKRWTLDEKSDYEFLRPIYEQLGAVSALFGMKDILSYLLENPHLEEINSQITRDEGYRKSLENESSVELTPPGEPLAMKPNHEK